MCCPLYLHRAIKIYCDGLIDTVNMHVHSKYWEAACVLENTQCKELFGYGKYNHFQTSTIQMVPHFAAPEKRESTHINNELHICRHNTRVLWICKIKREVIRLRNSHVNHCKSQLRKKQNVVVWCYPNIKKVL